MVRRLVLAALLLAACGTAAAADPAAVAEACLRAGSAENAEQVQAHLDPACASDEAMTRVDAVGRMGAPIQAETLSVELGDHDEDTATVRFAISGPAHRERGTTPLFGAEVTTGAVDIAEASRAATCRSASSTARGA
jgi:hypothetical protein